MNDRLVTNVDVVLAQLLDHFHDGSGQTLMLLCREIFRCNDDYWNMIPLFPGLEKGKKLKSIHDGHHDIEEDDTGDLFLEN